MSTIKAYHRPASLADALHLLAEPGRAVIGGGTHLLAHLPDMVDEIVDLQAVPGLDYFKLEGQTLHIGALVRLQTLVEAEQAPPLLREAAHREGPNTYRNAATLGGIVAGPDSSSELIAALLVLDATVHVQTSNGSKTVGLPQFLQDVRANLSGGIITGFSLATAGPTASDRVARTPADRPIVAAVARLGPDDKIRLALSGVSNVPVLVEPNNVKAAVNPAGDFRGSREYRRQMAATLARRVVGAVQA